MVSSSSAAGFIAVTSLFAAVNGHMIMKTPVPYGAATLDNSPLDASGSDYPCKQRSGVYDAPTTTNTMAIGENQTLSFTGSAVHGGGSCQISLSTDTEPTTSSTWMVIHSIEGGCPATADGNLSGNDDTTFQFSVPEGIAPGNYALAWTWFNSIGNREMYMNCAPVTVTAAKKKRYAPAQPAKKRATSFPGMAVANLASINSCTTDDAANHNVQYASPGDSVQNSCSSTVECVGLTVPEGTDVSSCLTGAGTSSGNASSSGSSSAAASAPAATAASSAISQSSPGVFASVSSSATEATATAAATSAAAVVPTVATSAAAPSSTAAASGSSNGTATAGASCSTEGETDCAADGQSYLECASGYWQTMSVAAGTSCTAGVSESINIVVSALKRDHKRSHLHRRSHA